MKTIPPLKLLYTYVYLEHCFYKIPIRFAKMYSLDERIIIKHKNDTTAFVWHYYTCVWKLRIWCFLQKVKHNNTFQKVKKVTKIY